MNDYFLQTFLYKDSSWRIYNSEETHLKKQASQDFSNLKHTPFKHNKNTLKQMISKIRFSFVSFYGISTTVGYLMLKPLYTYIY